MLQRIPAEARHCEDHGWLRTCWLFSFDTYHDPENMHFGALRVFNDDVVAPGQGFPEHPHREMEIITLPLSGALTHTDSTGAHGTVGPNEIQHMSAGTGVRHAEMNAGNEPVHLYQIWIIPREAGLPPSYDQRRFDPARWHNRITPLASGQGIPDTVPIHADATIYRAAFDEGFVDIFETHTFRRLFFYVTGGVLEVEDAVLGPGDQGRLHPEGTQVHMKVLMACDFVLIDVPPA
ncbi:MAG: Quercetin 2,3-dioxygenase [bacterium ADurb.Bin429]|nr:MAG: Quercetin 2,3-dioxygenase [bacterium ADurb.Bin429]